MIHTKTKKHLDILCRNNAFEFTQTFFPYTSGQIGNYYVQSAVIMKQGSDFAEAIKDMKELVVYNTRAYSDNLVISGGETRDWIFSFPVAAGLQKPHVMIYKDGKIIGADMKSRSVAHVADLNNEGSSPRDLWVPAIKKAGGNIEDIFFYIDRMEEGTEVMKGLGLESHSLVEMNKEAWTYLMGQRIVDRTVYENSMKRLEDKDAWARTMLRSDSGFNAFKELWRTQHQKAVKILEKGYPDMKEEMIERLNR